MDPGHRRLVLLDLPVALADLGLRAELAIPARLWRRRHAKDIDGAGVAWARRNLLSLRRATGPIAAGFLDAAPAAGGFPRRVSAVPPGRGAAGPPPARPHNAAGGHGFGPKRATRHP